MWGRQQLRGLVGSPHPAFVLGARGVPQQRVLAGAGDVADGALPGREGGQELGALGMPCRQGRKQRGKGVGVWG